MRPTRFVETVLLLGACLAAGCVSAPDAPETWNATVNVTSVPSESQVVWFQPRSPESPGGPTEIGTTPFDWDVSPAQIGNVETVTLVAYRPGHGRERLDVPVETLRSGGPVAFEIPAFATLTVLSDPIATFELTDEGGVSAAADVYAPRTIEELTPGTYMLRAHRDGYADHEQSVQLRAGEQVTARYTLEPLPAPPDGEPRLSVRPGPVEGVEPTAFYDAVVAQMRNLGGCYDRALADDPTAAGEIELRLELNLPFGSVEGAEVTRTDISDAETLDCAQRRLRRVEYAPVEGGGRGSATVTLHYHRIAPP